MRSLNLIPSEIKRLLLLEVGNCLKVSQDRIRLLSYFRILHSLKTKTIGFLNFRHLMIEVHYLAIRQTPSKMLVVIGIVWQSQVIRTQKPYFMKDDYKQKLYVHLSLCEWSKIVNVMSSMHMSSRYEHQFEQVVGEDSCLVMAQQRK